MEARRIYFVLIQILDLVLTVFAFAHLYSLGDVLLPRLFQIDDQLWLIPLILLIVHVSFFSFGLYEFRKPYFFAKPFWYAIPASIASGFVFYGLMYLFKNLVSRTFFVLLFAYLALLVCVERLIIELVYRRRHSRQTGGSRNLIIVGISPTSVKIAEMFESHPEFDSNIHGFIAMDKTNTVQTVNGKPVLGTLENFEEILRTWPIDEAIFCIKQGWEGGIDKYLLACEETGVTIRIVADFFNLMLSKTSLDDFFGVPLLTFQTTPDRTFALFAKRIIDFVGALLGLIVLSPLLLLIALLIKITMPGPILFVQERAGLSKRRFPFFKFRSMVVDADQLKNTLDGKNEMDGPVFKIKDDPRVTPLGRFLRRYSLDELPQLFNVLMGDMSLVGPRPPIPAEVEKYERWQLRRLSMRPGITCIWQVSGRNTIGFLDWMKMDLYYIDNWSLWLDLQILVKTIPAVLGGHGAS